MKTRIGDHFPSGCGASNFWMHGRLPAGLIVVSLFFAGIFSSPATDTLVTPGISAEAQSLMAYFGDIYGKKILSGQQDGSSREGQPEFELEHIKKHTGKLPAVSGFDFSAYTLASAPFQTRSKLAVTQRAIEWYTQSNGIVALCWHWHVPAGNRAFYTKDTDFDLRRALQEGTPEHEGIIRDIDLIAEELKKLRDAHVPVLWRPLHEANGRWFWWGNQGPEPFKQLWRLIYERFTGQHKLNNLIWVFSPGADLDLAGWYPGDEFVDIIGQDHYPMDGNNGPAKDVFDELIAFGHGNKLLGLSENGPIPAPDRLVSEKAGWLFFITWSGNLLTEKNSPEQLAAVYRHPYVLNLADLPDLKTYPFRSAGKAVKLGFPAPPSDVAIGSPGRQPVTVAVEDAEGRIVREGKFAVTLLLGKNAKRASLTGTLTATTRNGIATFPDLKIDQAVAGYAFNASARGLKSATSPAFDVGPGAGLLREWWSGLSVKRMENLGMLDSPPSGREIVGAALEVPYGDATNFTARTRGYIHPPLTGRYVFWIANEALSELWLSADEAPARKIKIAEITGHTPYVKWPHTHEAESAPVQLEAGKKYYLEVIQHQPAGSAHLSVRWRLPDGVAERPIPGSRFSLPETGLTESKAGQNSSASNLPAGQP